MRFVLTIVFTLLIFTTNQVAQAYEACCEETVAATHEHGVAASEHPHGHGDSDKQDMPDHCAMSGHHVLSITPKEAIAHMPRLTDSRTDWPEITSRESFIGEGLIEPPSLA